MQNPLVIKIYPLRLLQRLVLVTVIIILFSISPRSTNAQIGSEIIWEEGKQVVVGGNQPAAASILAVPTTPGTYYRTYSGTAFQPTDSSLTYSSVGGAVYLTSLPSTAYSLSLDIDLPHGATITEVVFFFIDNEATNYNFSLRLYNPETDDYAALESANSTGASPALQTITLAVDPPVVVDNTINSYRLRVAPSVASSAQLFRGARVGFTIPTTYLPFLER